MSNKPSIDFKEVEPLPPFSLLFPEFSFPTTSITASLRAGNLEGPTMSWLEQIRITVNDLNLNQTVLRNQSNELVTSGVSIDGFNNARTIPSLTLPLEEFYPHSRTPSETAKKEEEISAAFLNYVQKIQDTVNALNGNQRLLQDQLHSIRSACASRSSEPINVSHNTEEGASRPNFSWSRQSTRTWRPPTPYHRGRRQCLGCRGKHCLSNCEVFPTIHVRKQVIEQLKRCLTCFSRSHSSENCKSTGACCYCSAAGFMRRARTHNSALCEYTFPPF